MHMILSDVLGYETSPHKISSWKSKKKQTKCDYSLDKSMWLFFFVEQTLDKPMWLNYVDSWEQKEILLLKYWDWEELCWDASC